MEKTNHYSGIDYFRFIAAILIIAIHTSPLASYSEIGNFIFTRVIARVGVPFFFMTSGFLIIKKNNGKTKAINFVKKTAVIYGVSILVYIPINIYTGYFQAEDLALNIVKDILFDGTFYHLWYLPASIVGILISWYLLKKFSYTKAIIIASILYIIGLFGDSYYGISEQMKGIQYAYQIIFQISDYSRNGLFFAPIFMILGGLIADQRKTSRLKHSLLGFMISFALMVTEALLLNHFKIQRHDSMYLFLIPCMYFIFHIIISLKGKRHLWLRKISLIMYIIHPMIIIVVRMIAKLINLEVILIDNSMVHFFLVTLMTMITSVSMVFVDQYITAHKPMLLFNPYQSTHPTMIAKEKDRAYIGININNLEHNVNVLKSAMPEHCQLMAVLKRDAYGHGVLEMSTYLNRIGVKEFAVATIDEGIDLRKHGIRGNILILGYTNVIRASELKKYDLIQTIIDFEYAESLNKQRVPVKTHIKIDTGMHRLGIPYEDVANIIQIFDMKYISVQGIFTHLSCSDSQLHDDVVFTRTQIDCFYTLIDELKKQEIEIPKLHIQSSYGLLNYPELKCNYVRVGIALYGVLSAPGDDTVLKLDLRPVLSLKSKIILIRTVTKGSFVGYGRSYIAERDSLLAIIPIGYGDGFPRSLSYGKGNVRINQYTVPIISRICMDHLIVDITDTAGIQVGDEVTLIDAEGFDGFSASDVAETSGSISNELLSRMGNRLPIVIN